jgi:Fur family ferric uptake transcriptional regulator
MNETQVFMDHLKATGLKGTTQRKTVLDAFLATEKHVSVDDLYRAVNRGRRRVGYATVHRTMKLIAQSGLACEVQFDDGVARYEHAWGREHSHHHHLVCTRCRNVIEFESAVIDREERFILRKHGFEPHSHRYEVFGLCARCRRRASRAGGRQP